MEKQLILISFSHYKKKNPFTLSDAILGAEFLSEILHRPGLEPKTSGAREVDLNTRTCRPCSPAVYSPWTWP